MRVGYSKSPEGIVSQKMTMGLAFLYLPFYGIASLNVWLAGLPNDEYSPPFGLWMCIGAIFYFLAGMLMLRKVLLRYFSELVVILGLCCVFLGTNLVYYTAYEGCMSHVYNFFLISSFLWLVIRWHDQPKWGNSLLLGIIGGLIVLTRPSNVTVLLIAVLWNTHNRQLLKEKAQLIKNHLPKVIVLLLCAFLVWVPQMLYWHYATGHWLYFSYGNEKFFFDKPHILLGLLSYRNGWLVYSPVMVFSLIGIFFLRRNLKAFFWPVLVYFLLSIYIIFSWWCWWYVGLGSRAMIDTLPVMAIPLCAFIAWILTKKALLKAPVMLVMMTLLLIGLFKNYQYKKSIIHFDGMTGKAYWCSFFWVENQGGNYYDLIKSPDYSKAAKGEE
jgi:hypothetical protein